MLSVPSPPQPVDVAHLFSENMLRDLTYLHDFMEFTHVATLFDSHNRVMPRATDTAKLRKNALQALNMTLRTAGLEVKDARYGKNKKKHKTIVKDKEFPLKLLDLLKLRVQDDDLSGCAYPELVPLLLDPSLAHYGGLVDRWARQPPPQETAGREDGEQSEPSEEAEDAETSASQ